MFCRSMRLPRSRRSSTASWCSGVQSPGSGAGSSKVVAKPGTGGVSQRRARARPNDCTLPAAASEFERPLHGTLAGVKRERQSRTRPQLTVGQEGKHRRMLFFDGPCQHDDLGCAARRQRKPSLRRVHAGQRAKRRAQPSDFHAQSRAMRFIGDLRSESARDECVPGHVPGPRVTARVPARQHRTPGEQTPCVRRARHDGTRPRRAPSTPVRPQPPRAGRGRSSPRVMRRAAGVSTRTTVRVRPSPASRNTCVVRGAPGPERARRGPSPIQEASHRDSRDDQFVRGPRRGREGRGVEFGQTVFGFIEARRSEQPAELEMPRMRRVHPVAVRFQRCPRRVERLRLDTQVARDQCDLGLCDDAPRAGHGLLRTEGARRASQEGLRAIEIAELLPSRCRERERGRSSRRATRFNAPIRSPVASARAAAAIASPSESRHTCHSHRGCPVTNVGTRART